MNSFTEAAAMAAMAGLTANSNVRIAEKELVARAWKIADLMNTEREQRFADEAKAEAEFKRGR